VPSANVAAVVSAASAASTANSLDVILAARKSQVRAERRAGPLSRGERAAGRAERRGRPRGARARARPATVWGVRL
jgi:hypothetical protein